jgi:c-di-GMP-binding flagellar brake protein YcgR
MNGAGSSSADLLSVNALVAVRLAEHDTEYSSRIEDIEGGTLIVAAPPGANAALLATGERDVELSWVTPRGRYEQRCALVEHINNGGLKQWRLRPTGEAKLIQRRRYVRVPAALAVLLVMPGEVMTATTVDVSEGGFRVRMPRCDIAEHTPVGIQVNMGGSQLELRGIVLRTAESEHRQTEAVLSFEPTDKESDAIRRFVFQMQLRARAMVREA